MSGGFYDGKIRYDKNAQKQRCIYPR